MRRVFSKCGLSLFFKYYQVRAFFDCFFGPCAISAVGLATNCFMFAHLRAAFCRASGCIPSVFLNKTEASLIFLLAYIWKNGKEIITKKKRSIPRMFLKCGVFSFFSLIPSGGSIFCSGYVLLFLFLNLTR